MNPFDDWLQRLLGQQQQQPPVGPVQPQIQTQQPFSTPTPAPDPQNPFVEGLRNVMRNVGTFVAARPEMRMGRAVGNAVLDGAPQREAWNALMGQQPSFPSQNVQNMTPDQQFQVFSDVGGMVNPMAGATRLKLSGQFNEPPDNFFESLFSRLQRGIQDAPVSPKGATAKEWLGILTPKTAKGEREFTGIESLLKADPERVITKGELDELAKKKGVQFSEVVDHRYEDYIQPGDAENYRMIMLVREPSEEIKAAIEPFRDALKKATAEANEADAQYDRLRQIADFIIEGDQPTARELAEAGRKAVEAERIYNQAKTLFMQKQEELLDIPYQSHNNVPKNTLAHLRLSDRIDPVTGQRTLFVEELQSDMLQELRDYGPIQGTKAQHDAEVDRLTEIAKSIRESGPGGFNPVTVERAFSRAKRTPDLPQPLSAKRITKKPEETFNELRAWMEDPENAPEWEGVYTSDQIRHTIRYLKAAAEAEMASKRVPSGQPFTKGEEWTELLLKRVLKEAVDGGYDTVVLPRGEQVHNVVGGPRSAMAQYYETNVPNILKDYGKKLGVKIEMGETPTKNVVYRPQEIKNEVEEAIDLFRNSYPGSELRQVSIHERPELTPVQASVSRSVLEILQDLYKPAERGQSIRPDWDEVGGQKLKAIAETEKEQIARNSALSPEQKQAMIDEWDKEVDSMLNEYPFNVINRGTNLTFRITPDLKSAVSKGQRLWGTAAASLPGTMELLRQRNGLPKREEKKKQ